MPKFLVLVMSNPREGMEEEFNDWYEHTHLDEVLATTDRPIAVMVNDVGEVNIDAALIKKLRLELGLGALPAAHLLRVEAAAEASRRQRRPR